MSAAPPLRWSAVVLAAGGSTRMQGRHKLLLPVAGEAAVRRTVRAVLGAGPQETVVVTGHGEADVAAALAELPVRIVANPRFADGQMTSVSAGVAALTLATDAAMICLADMVLLSSADYRALVEEHARHTDKSMLVPRHAGRRGNPVVIAQWRLPEVLAGRRNTGCRKLIEDNPDDVHVFEANHDRYVHDMDTPEDYEAVLRRIAAAAPRKEARP